MAHTAVCDLALRPTRGLQPSASRAATRALGAMTTFDPVHDPDFLSRSIVHMGSAAATRGLERQLLAGGGAQIGIVGASVAQAAGCLDQPQKRCMDYRGLDLLWNPVPPHTPANVRIKGFLIRFLERLNASHPSTEHRLFNGAADATPAPLIAECLFSHLPRQTHLVILEFGSMAKSTTRESVEAIVRALLDVPSPPALVFLTVREWAHRRVPKQLVLYGQSERTSWAHKEEEFLRLCRHYDQTCLSYFEAAPITACA